MEEFRDQTGSDCHGEAKLQEQSSPGIAPFDHSVDGFFATMDSISALSGEPPCAVFLPSQIERFSSMVMFLKEWQQFYYEPKVLNFSYESESGQVNDFSEGVTLPQFSSASVSVPEMESLPENVRSSSRSDFVLHVGGSVWALDWCPRTDEKTESQVNCEYLAVAAHPPGASYHKIGVPLVGRGLIQIWCLTSLDKKKELPQVKPKGRGRPKIILKQSDTDLSHELNQNEFSATRRKRGRPRKSHAEDDALYDLDNKKILHLPKPRGRPRKIEKLSTDDLTRREILPARPRGRPRKHMNQGLIGPDSVNGLILGRSTRTLESMDDKDAPPSTDHVSLSTMHCVSVVNVDAGDVVEVPISDDMKEEPAAPKRRGRPRKKALLSANKNLEASAAAVDEYAINNDKILSANTYITPLDVDSGEAVFSSHVLANGSVNSETNAPKQRGRPRMEPLSSTNKFRQESVVELQLDASGNGVLTSTDNCMAPSHIGLGNISSLSVTSGNLVVEKASCVCSVDDIAACSVEIDMEAYGNNLISSRGDGLPYLNADLQHVALPLTTSAGSIIKEKLFFSGYRGQPRESTISSANKGVLTPGVDVEANASGSSLTLNSNKSMTPLNSHSGIATVFPTSGHTHAEEKSFVPRPGGRPVDQFNQSTSKTVSTSGADFKLFSNLELASSGENFISGDCQSEIIVSDACEGVTNGRANTMSCSHIPENIALPRMVFSLAHNGKVAWDVKWRPKTSIKSEGKQHIGYLAVLLGSGSVEVWDVPHPSLVRRLYISSRIEGTDPRFLKLEPVFKCSKIKCGDRQCIPLTLEWSRSGSSDLMLAGCHDGTVALWKFSSHRPSQDTRPLLCFTADAGPIRSLAWAPEESDPESLNLVVTTGPEGLKFWDLRDPYRPLWEPYPVQRAILSLEWTNDPRCVIISLDDGTLRTFSLWDLANDGPVIGKPSDGMKQPAWHSYFCSPFALWSIQVSRSTGLAAYCSAEGSTYYFKLTVNSLKDPRNRLPHILCGSLLKDGETLKISTPSLVTKHMSNCTVTSQALIPYTAGANQAGPKDSKSSLPGNRIFFFPEMKKPKSKPKNVQDISKQLVQISEHGCREAESEFLDFPSKILAMHRVRWNMNKGSERWLCYGGAAGIVRCQEIS
ncbi:general transcription factor 3C polypeptide 2 protein [Dioscorea alata]|uniref:General transcription factor 3C polypeptide 2 protein n=3 Tax=Dioscorea alata TaxID=55571 RepID=A0ACB7US08_DIOAL|nr:general transcription factor 3C polypeptide 2 protein [Dioscorea alata]KAH7663448.1 general transcription factor 3C polypeptide 2 protein [Dioscorea alata]KAH7663449.1 general transcription factor 3C polypeptide 2 protein [Dioscorea alata]